jgi:predicted Fe-Mo cluster-binding NifX family protein
MSIFSLIFGLQEWQMEKIAVSSESPDMDARVDPRFGRAAGFMIVDPETMAFEYVDNGSSQVMAQGAGIQAAEIVAATGARVLLTGFVGPKAFQALNAAGIAIGQNVDNLTVREAVQRFQAGDVPVADAPNRRGHRS